MQKQKRKIKDISKHMKSNSDVLKYSFRLGRLSTSITLRKNVVCLWLVIVSLNTIDQNLDNDFIKSFIRNFIRNFIESCLEDWYDESAKGLSDFITNRMIQEVLEKVGSDMDCGLYNSILERI